MPQKKNPDTLELVRARTGDAVSGLTGVLTTLKGLPRAYNRDLQRATTHLWDSVDAVTESVPVATGALRTATWPEETLAAAAGEGFSTATGVADRLAMAGVPFRSAHEVVARAAREADGDTPDADALDAASRAVLDRPLAELVDVTDIDAALDPWGSVAMRDSRGGPAPSAVAAQLDRARETLAEHRERAGGARDGLDASDQRLTDEVARYA